MKQAIFSGTIKDVSQGEVIIDQGVAGKEFFVLLEGAASATHRDPDGSIHTLAYLKAGDLFGEVAELSQRSRIARVTANEKTQVLEMKWENIKRLGRYHPRIAMRLYRNLARILSQRIAEFTEDRERAHDELTGALTKPYLCEIFQQEMKRSKYFAETMSLILLNIDIQPLDKEIDSDLSNMKDVVVIAITKIISRLIQAPDVLARWEKCSFMLLLPKSSSADAYKLAQKIEDEIKFANITELAHIHINVAVTETMTTDQGQDAIIRLEKKLLEFKQSHNSAQISLV